MFMCTQRHSARRLLVSSVALSTALLFVNGLANAQVPELVQHWPLDGDYLNEIDKNFDAYLGESPASTEVLFDPVEVGPNEIGPNQEDAALFQGANNYLQTGFPGIGGTDARSITFWMKTTQPGANDMFGYGTPANGLKWHTRVNTGGQGPVGAIRTEYQGGQNVGGEAIVDDGTWHHIEGATNGHQIIHYVDGVVQSIDPRSADRAINTQLNPLYNVTIGLTRQSTTANRWYNGWLADLRVYSGGLTAINVEEVMTGDELSEPEPCTSIAVACEVSEETNAVTATVTLEPEGCVCATVQVTAGERDLGFRSTSGGVVNLRLDQLCALAAGEDLELTFTCLDTEVSGSCMVSCPEQQGLVVHWPLDEGEGEEFIDLVSGFDGYLDAGSTITWDPDGPPAGPDGEQTAAVAFDGSTSYIQTDYPGIWGSAARTITAWIKTSAPVANHGIVAWGQDLGTRKWHIRVNNNAGNGLVGGLRVEVNGGFAIGSTPLADGQWHHIAIVVPDGASSTTDVLHYVDGFFDPPSGVLPLEINTNASGILPARTLGIGRRVNGNGTANYFPGSIADVRVYDRALSAAELLRLGSDRTCRALRRLSTSRFVPGDSVTVSITAGNVVAGSTLTETLPDGWTVSGNPDGGVVADSTITFQLDADAEISYELTVPEDYCEVAEITGTLSGDGCDSSISGASTLACLLGCTELSEFGGVRDMLILGPIAAGRNTSPTGQCDDAGPDGTTFDTVDYLATADGTDETNLDVAIRDEIAPDFGGAAAGAGVAPAPNLTINPRRDEGILTVWSADADDRGRILFNDADNIGNPLDDYIVYSLVYLDNRSGAALPVVLEVGSDDAAKVLVNGELVAVAARCHGVQAYGAGIRVPLDGVANPALVPGANTVLIGVVERGGGTGVRLVIRDELDAPLVDGSVVSCLSTEHIDIIDPIEICTNGVDDDGDGEVDCDDSDCEGTVDCPTGELFVRGDSNSSGTIDLTDGIRTLNFLFTGGPAPTCLDAADSSDDGVLGINDAIQIFSYLFTGGDAPKPPAPSNAAYPAEDCDLDPTDDDLGCETLSATCEGGV